jgi:hypothetical protein
MIASESDASRGEVLFGHQKQWSPFIWIWPVTFFQFFHFLKKIHIVAKIGQIKTIVAFKGKESEVVRLGRGGY